MCQESNPPKSDYVIVKTIGEALKLSLSFFIIKLILTEMLTNRLT